MLDVNAIRADFPILTQQVNDHPLVYLDNAATTQKPQVVLDTVSKFYSQRNSNIHRGVHHLSEFSSREYEQAREAVRQFINARSHTEIIFTSGTTDSINLVAQSFGRQFVKPGDEIIVTEMEHHSNFLPWQALCDQVGSTLRIVPFADDGTLQLDVLESLFTDRTRLLAVTYVSNVLGVINPIKEIVELAHEHDVPVLVDGAQAIQHLKVDVQDLDCDFFAFSGHKTYAETGIGVLYGKEKWLDAMPPHRTGGGMVKTVRADGSVYADLPFKFEAGTPNYVGAISLQSALEYMNAIGMDNISNHETQLVKYALESLRSLPGITIYGGSLPKSSAIAFNLDGAHPYDAGILLNKLGIAIRTGTHCAELVMQHYEVPGTMRASFAVYNTRDEIDSLIAGLEKAQAMLAG